MAIRLSGLNSGLDTEAIIKELINAKSEKKKQLKKGETKLQWKQDAWKELNKKYYSFYTNALSGMRFSTNYSTKKTTVSDSSVADIVSTNQASNGQQTLEIASLAKTGYLTGGKLSLASGENLTLDTKLSELGINSDTSITVNGNEVALSADMTLQGLTNAMRSATEDKSVMANFDVINQRIFVNSARSGLKNEFTLGGDEQALKALKLYVDDSVPADPNTGIISDATTGAVRIKAQDALIKLNGAEFTSNTNTISVNGLNITAKRLTEPGTTVSVNTVSDTDATYKNVKSFIKDYNELIKELDTKYNAESAAKLDPLNEEDKEAMGEEDAKLWETKIKDGILRRDESLGKLRNTLSSLMSEGIVMSDGTTKHLSDYGIGNESFLTAAVEDRGLFHIDGDSEDSVVAAKDDKLRTAITARPEEVEEFFREFGSRMYKAMTEATKSSDLNSAFTVYNDKVLKKEEDAFKKKIATQEKLIARYEDKYYKQFTAMEKALAMMKSRESAISGLFNTN